MIEQIGVRQAISSDIPRLISMDHGFSTDHVWQLSYRKQPSEIDRFEAACCRKGVVPSQGKETPFHGDAD